MALELVQCPHCGYKFRIDVERAKEDGEIIVVRGFLDRLKTNLQSSTTIDTKCPNCEKWFELEL